tara:strand:- start:377 stop:1195 length:819 start_codon:yes stop_codon:yes gene_type:complete
MIVICYFGGLGNNMFQYAFGKILSEAKKCELKYIETDEKYNIDYEKRTNRKRHPYPKQMVDLFGIKLEKFTGDLKNFRLVKGHIHNMQELIDYKGDILMKSSGYQNINYYKNHKNLIKSLFSINKDEINFKPESNDLVIHYRGGENINQKMRYMDATYFIDCINLIKKSKNISKIYILTDSPNFKEIIKIKDKFNCTVICRNTIDDYKFMCCANNLIIPHSTYSWWAAWLSDATTIYMPKSFHQGNIKYHCDWANKGRNIDLVVDEKRYLYV